MAQKNTTIVIISKFHSNDILITDNVNLAITVPWTSHSISAVTSEVLF